MMKTYIVSYPKSGRTWLRALVGKYLTLRYNLPDRNMLEVSNLTKLIPDFCDIVFTHDNSSWIDKNPTSWDKEQYQNQNVILLKRNVYDIVVSSYFQMTKRDKVFNGTITELLNSEWNIVERICFLYKSWQENSRVAYRYNEITYEEMHDNTTEVLVGVLSMSSKQCPDLDCVQEAVKFCRFEQMQKMEKQNYFKSERLKASNINDPESFKVRNGKVNGYRDYLTFDDMLLIDSKIKNAAERYEKYV